MQLRLRQISAARLQCLQCLHSSKFLNMRYYSSSAVRYVTLEAHKQWNRYE